MKKEEKWGKATLAYCMRLFKAGMTDAKVASILTKKTGMTYTPHAIRSKRGRLERSGKLKVGAAGSSKEFKMTKPKKKRKKKRQFWSKEAEKAAIDLHQQGLKAKRIATQLKKQGLRDSINAQAVSDRLLLLKKRGVFKEPKKATPPVAKKKILNSVSLKTKAGSMEFTNLRKETLAAVAELCMRD